MTGTSAAVQAAYWTSTCRPYRPAGRKAKYGRFSVLPRPEIYRNLRIKDSVKIDPACGTGGMLIEAIRNMEDEKASYGKNYGQEKNLSTSAIARMNLFLHGAKEFKIVREDTLRKPMFIHNGQLQQFDCVLANPPFGLDHWGAEIFDNDQWGRNLWGSPTDSNADYAWLQHIAFPATGKVWVNNHAHVIRFENMAIQTYVEHLLNMIDISHYVTGTAQPKLNQAKLNSIPIPVPEQMELQAYLEFVEQSDKSKFVAYQTTITQLFTRMIRSHIYDGGHHDGKYIHGTAG